nr:uncharacterized protein LOC111109508 isoform X2 [Crassostrea virginica]
MPVSNSRSLKPHLEALIGTLSVDPSKEKSADTLSDTETATTTHESNVGPKQKGKRKRSDKEMEEMKKRKEENKVQKELETSAQKAASATILELRKKSGDKTANSSDLNLPPSLPLPARTDDNFISPSSTSTPHTDGTDFSNAEKIDTLVSLSPYTDDSYSRNLNRTNSSSILTRCTAGTSFSSADNRSTLVSMSPCTDDSFQSKNWASTSPANSSSTLTARTAETGFWSNEKRNTLVSLSPYTDDSFNTRNLSRTISSSISTPCTAESFTSSERRSTLVSLSPYTDETPVNSMGTCTASTLMSPFTDEAINTMGRPEISGCVQEPHSMPNMQPIRPMPLYENQTSQYMRSAFSTLYPEELCVTKCHSCCSVVREHEKRIAHLEQALESLQRSIKKKHLKGSVEEERTKGPLGIDLEELKSTLQLKRNCSEGVNYLLLKLYTIEELTTSSVMGVSTKKGQRKGLNEEKRAIIEGLITEIFPGITVTSIHNIMRDRLKLLRKKHT